MVTEGKTLEDYSEDRLLRQAIERNFEIVGEAVGQLARNDPETASRLSEHERIVAFRHVLIHGYDLVDESWCGTRYGPSFRFSCPRSRSY
jgi:uncharacterized protein with HEPN domain